MKINRINLVASSIMLLFLVTSIVAASAADDGNVLKLGIQINEFKLMNSLVRPWYDSANCFFSLTQTSLIIYKPDLDIVPGLASSWEIAPDGKSVKFTLVENATWSDGKPVTAEDAAFSLEYWKKNKLYTQGNWYNSYLDHVDIIDNYTVNVVFKEQVAAASLSTIVGTSIIPKHVWEKIEKPKEYDGDNGMVGCGPFIFEKYDRDAQIVYLKANPAYFAGKPSADRIEWHYYRTLDALLLALKKGDIDAQLEYYNPVPGVYAADLLKSENIKLITVPDVGLPLHLVFGFRKYPSNITEFRQAVSYAIDYQALIDMIAAGYGKVPGKGYSVPQLPGFNPNLPKLEYNATKARDLLNSSGFIDKDGDGFRETPKGTELKIPITVDASRPQEVRAAEIIDRELHQIGLNTYVEALSSDATNQKLNVDKDYYMFISRSTPSANCGARSGIVYYADFPGCYGTCKDPELIELSNKMIYSKNMEELIAARSAIQEYVAKEQPIIPLIWADAIYPVRTDRWEGWTPMYGYGPVNYWSWFSMKPVGK
ncbi:MAG: Bacterial extracellular solute-binding proteins, family 5 Middle [Methanosaeta sp. PtaU1.Bin112]|nr:MAG: Bacterial extracellular solute-binding proteins, family 5 Middle [Methanosaeta sp. PtaU1.Bin112]